MKYKKIMCLFMSVVDAFEDAYYCKTCLEEDSFSLDRIEVHPNEDNTKSRISYIGRCSHCATSIEYSRIDVVPDFQMPNKLD